MKKAFFLLLFALVLCIGLLLVIPAFAETEGDWEYTSDGRGATVTGYHGSATVLTIPDTLGGYPVTSIGYEAFAGCINFIDVYVPDSVTYIGRGAFAGCASLETIRLPFVGETKEPHQYYYKGGNEKYKEYYYPCGWIFYDDGSNYDGCIEYVWTGVCISHDYFDPHDDPGWSGHLTPGPNTSEYGFDFSGSIPSKLKEVIIPSSSGPHVSLGYEEVYHYVFFLPPPITLRYENKVLVDIEIKTAPNKLEYEFGECFDETGLVVMAIYNDGSSKVVTEYSCEPDPDWAIIIPEDYLSWFVTVTYTEGDVTKTAMFPITVKLTKNTLYSISITTPPMKTKYKAGETFDPAGMVVTATYTDMTSEAVRDYTLMPQKLGIGDHVVTVSYSAGGVTLAATQLITVRPSDQKENPFEDVKETDVFYDAVMWAFYAQPQVTTGMDYAHFGPEGTVTRGQAMAFLWRAVGCPEPNAKNTLFVDVPENAYYYEPILWAVENGITNGTDSTHFTPNQTCSTAHFITFLYRALHIGPDGWYEEAGSWAQRAGLLNGLSLKVEPGVDCPRAYVVLFLYRQLAR